MKRRMSSIAMKVAATGCLIVAAAPVAAGTLLNGASVNNGARGVTNGSFVDGPAKVILPDKSNSQIDVMAANINLPANGGGVDWHTHPGPTFGIVTCGLLTGCDSGATLTIIDDDCVAHIYKEGDAFVAPINPHTARNFSDKPVTVRATFVLPHSSGPMPTMPTEFVSQDDDNTLDAYCGLLE